MNSLCEIKSKVTLYKLIAAGFGYPSKELYFNIKKNEYFDEFKSAFTGVNLNVDLDLLANSKNLLTLKDDYFQDYEARYIMDFETNKPKPSCSLYERNYVENFSNAQILLELKAFYKNFELTKSVNFHDAEDHIVFELEFMHFLTFKELQALEMGLDYTPYQKCKKDFLKRHLLQWIPKLEQKMLNNKVSDFHQLLISTLNSLINHDYQTVKEEVVIN